MNMNDENRLIVSNVLDKLNEDIIKNWTYRDLSIPKICDFGNEFKYSEEQMINKIYSGDLPIRYFIKDAKKRNNAESVVIELLNKYGIKTKKIPTCTTKSLYLCGSEIKRGNRKKLNNEISFNTHSLDLELIMNGKKYYATHKIIEHNGGGQNLQFDELKSFIVAANNMDDNQPQLIVLVDGKYFTGNKMNELKKLTKKNKVFVCHTGDLLNK